MDKGGEFFRGSGGHWGEGASIFFRSTSFPKKHEFPNKQKIKIFLIHFAVSRSFCVSTKTVCTLRMFEKMTFTYIVMICDLLSFLCACPSKK